VKHNTQAASGARSLDRVGAFTHVRSDAATVAAVCLCERMTLHRSGYVMC